jgi:hypothetical protein
VYFHFTAFSRKFAFVANLVPAALLQRYSTTTSTSVPIR